MPPKPASETSSQPDLSGSHFFSPQQKGLVESIGFYQVREMPSDEGSTRM